MTTHQPCTAARHGTALAYQVDKCRCPHGREAYRLYRKRLKEKRNQPLRVPSHGVTRRLQALAALGWPAHTLAARLGYTDVAVQQWRRGRHSRVRLATHQRVTALYEQLWDQPGPSTYTRRRAAEYGWAAPMAWDDIDDPDARPDTGARSPARGTPARIYLDDVDHLRGYGMTLEQVARRLGVETGSITQAQRRAARREAA